MSDWDIEELVLWGLKRHAEADREGKQFIFVEEIYAGAARISSRIEQFEGVARSAARFAIENRRAFVLLKKTLPGCGWFIADFANVNGDRYRVNCLLAEISAAVAERR
jgi:hypothetical protein